MGIFFVFSSVESIFKLSSPYQPTGDQPEAIDGLCRQVEGGAEYSTLMGVTGSGKTFTMANVIARCNRPALILSHNKTLAAQLYSEFKAFFPDNAVEYFVSYYDYYQPEAYITQTDTYIEKDLAINDEIEKMRLSASSALLSGRRDVIVISSVSCLYGIGNPEDFHANTLSISVGDSYSRLRLLQQLSDALYRRSDIEFVRGTFRVKGDSIDIYTAHSDTAYRIQFFDDEVEEIFTLEPTTGKRIDRVGSVIIYPANNFVTTKERIKSAINQIQDDMMARVKFFEEEDRMLEAKRIKSRVEYDLEMIREVGYCSGIENYSRYFDGRQPGSRPFCLLDYFSDDFITFVDESHVTLPQVHAMYGGDYSRKKNLIEHGFRLPSAFDNRPLRFEEFEQLTGQTLFVSATPADYELKMSDGVIVEQFIRPTGLLDPPITIHQTEGQIDNLIEEINATLARDERVLITTLTKRMSEELCHYLENISMRCRYLHSEIDNMERITLLEDFRKGLFDIIVGVNLLREGIDLPEVSLVAIMDADKEGFLRSARALTQTAGRAARNVNGRVIMYADRMTDSMRKTINETNSRRAKQVAYNEDNGIVPRQIKKANNRSILTGEIVDRQDLSENFVEYDVPYTLGRGLGMVAEDKQSYVAYDMASLDSEIASLRTLMEEASKKLDFNSAKVHRDKMYQLEHLRSKIKKEEQERLS